MIKRVLTFIVCCGRCSKESKPFAVHCTSITSEPSIEDYPFGWGSWTSSGWGATNYTRSVDVCPECIAALNTAEEGGTISVSPKNVLDGLAEI